MIPTPSPHGVSHELGERIASCKDNQEGETSRETRVKPSDKRNLLAADILDIKRSDWEGPYNVRISPGGHRLRSWTHTHKSKMLPDASQKYIAKRLQTGLQRTKGATKRLNELLKANGETIGNFIRLWRGVDTCLALSFSEETPEINSFKTKWWMFLSNEVVQRKSIHFAGKQWSAFCRYCEQHFGGAMDLDPAWNPGWPRIPEGTWMSKTPGTLTRLEYAQLSCLIGTRVLPAGDHVTVDLALLKHAKSLCDNRSLEPHRLALLEELGETVGKQMKNHVRPEVYDHHTGHISISNSGCYEFSRSEGGRRMFVLRSLSDWLKEKPDSSRRVILPTGESVIMEEGVERFKTVKPPQFKKPESLDQVKVDTGILTEDFEFSERERVGFQLLAWSFIKLLDEEYINEHGYPTGKPMPIKRDTVPEPGIKCRVVTKSMAAFVTYGQAFGHVMKELLQEDPTLRAGLSSGAQAFEWFKQLRAGNLRFCPKYVMVGDFESATDNIDHEAGRTAMHAFCKGIGITSGYIHGYIDLLLGPRIFEEDDEVYITRTGSLMGEPGTKSVLTILGKLANVYAQNGVASPFFATAGDDQIDADDNPENLLRYAEASELTTMIPSRDKWGVFKYFVRYCQQPLLPGEVLDRCEIAVPKVRLVSPEQKTNKGDEDTNPCYGKVRQLTREASWCEFPQMRLNFLILFLRNMAEYLEYKPELFLPPEWGGLGLYGVDQRSIALKLPAWKRCVVIQREQGCHLARRLLARWGSATNFSRGIVTEEDTAFEAYYTELLPLAYNMDEITDIFGSTKDMRFRDIVRELEFQGVLTLSAAVNKIINAQKYQNFWDIASVPPKRGYSTRTWSDRDRDMQKAFEPVRKVQEPNDSLIPGNPKGYPELFIWAKELIKLQRDVRGGEDGEIEDLHLPIIGTAIDGPRVFLHYDNRRLLGTGDRSRQHDQYRTHGSAA